MSEDVSENGKVQGIKIPLFPAGANVEAVLEWCDEIDPLVLLAKGGASMGTHDVPMAEQTQVQRDANMVTMGIMLASLRQAQSIRSRVRAMLRKFGQDNHGALARHLLAG